MKYKLFLIIVISMFYLSGFAQNDVANLNISGKTIGEVSVSDKPAIINFDQATYKNVSKAVLYIKQSSAIAAYKRSIRITDENDNELYTTTESKSESGMYSINVAAVRQKLSDKKSLKVYLLEDPVNEKMSIPSRQKLMVELHLK